MRCDSSLIIIGMYDIPQLYYPREGLRLLQVLRNLVRGYPQQCETILPITQLDEKKILFMQIHVYSQVKRDRHSQYLLYRYRTRLLWLEHRVAHDLV